MVVFCFSAHGAVLSGKKFYFCFFNSSMTGFVAGSGGLGGDDDRGVLIMV